MDSRATNHMTSDLKNMVIQDNYHGGATVQVGNGQTVPVSHTCVSFLNSNTTCRFLFLKNILCVPHIAKNLPSISQITKDNSVIVEFHYDHCLVKDKWTNEILLHGSLKDGLYQLQVSLPTAKQVSLSPATSISCSNAINSTFSSTTDSCSLNKAFVSHKSDVPLSLTKQWHARLGHPQVKTLKSVMNKVHVTGVFDNNNFCESCQFGKLSQTSFPKSGSTTINPLELVYSDLWGPAPVTLLKALNITCYL